MDKKYCVYLHRRKDNNEVFYVGSGTYSRATFKWARGSAWESIVNSIGYAVQIVQQGISKTESLALEQGLFDHYKNLINSQRPCVKSLSYEEVSSNLKYDESSPTCLTWLKESKRRPKGSSAGSLSNFNVKVNNEMLIIARVVWLLNKRELIDGLIIDHIDGDKTNNKISNLRQISQKLNCRNKVTKTGIQGIQFISQGNATRCTASVYNLHGVKATKSFSVDKYGLIPATALACNWRFTQIALLNDQGAGYTSRHGQ